MTDIEEIKEILNEGAYKITASGRSLKDKELMFELGIDEKTKGTLFLPVFVSPMWLTGGATGGNCWGGVAKEIEEPEEEETFESLNIFLNSLSPNLKPETYEKILNNVKYVQISEGEYYGNYTEKTFKYIKHEDIINYLENENKPEDNHETTVISKSKKKLS